MESTAVILAVSSPPGHAGRGIIRASGDGAFALAEACVAEAVPRARRITPVRLGLDGLDLPSQMMTFPGPASFTGEDVVELQLPGQPHLLDRIIDALIALGKEKAIESRRSEPGEFTYRAWLNGRLSLTEAEGVSAVIAARSDAELKAASMLRSGRLGAVAGKIADQLAGVLALVEAGIDFTDEEDVVAIEAGDLAGQLEEMLVSLREVLDRAIGMDVLQALPVVMLCGPPNAGKSTLFNALLSNLRAVVTEVPGTTRDVIIEPLQVDEEGSEILLVDAAGFDSSISNPIDLQMQNNALGMQAEADLLLHCLPVDDDAGWMDDPGVIKVRTKHDLDGAHRDGDIRVSTETGHGINELRELIRDRTRDGLVPLSSDAVALQPRHEASLNEAVNRLEEALSLVQGREGVPELVASQLREALDAIGLVGGIIAPEDVLGRIFSSFCIGK